MIPMLYKNFQRWSATGSVYLFSDTHFGDPSCRLMDPDWISPEEQVAVINRLVHRADTLILLGDVGELTYAARLHGYKVLVMGNHDGSRSKFEPIFDEIYEGPLFVAEKILISHEPIHGLPFCVNIHGHNHDPEQKRDPYHLNLAANICGYMPVSLAKLIKGGLVSQIPDIHRITIDEATERKQLRQEIADILKEERSPD